MDRVPRERARGTRHAVPAPLLAIGRVVHPRWRSGNRHPVLPRTSTPGPARTRSNAGGRRRHAEVGHAHPPSRSGARHRQRIPATASAEKSKTLRQMVRERTRSTTSPGRTAAVSSSTSARGTRKAIPAEDFAETFAVWLTPHSEWRHRYKGWRALKKLEYMDELMTLIAGRKPLVTTRRVVDPIHTIKRTLGSTMRANASTTGSIIRSSMIATCDGCSPTRLSTRHIRRPQISCTASGVMCAGMLRPGHRRTSTRSIRFLKM